MGLYLPRVLIVTAWCLTFLLGLSEAEKDCVAHMLRTAGIGQQKAQTYSKAMASFRVHPNDLKTASTLALRLIGIVEKKDRKMIISCFSSSVNDSMRPASCVGFSACDEFSTCITHSSAPYFVCRAEVCAGHPCLNGGTCRGTGITFTCDCAIGFAGRHCEEKYLTRELELARLDNAVYSINRNSEFLIDQVLHNMSALIARLDTLTEAISVLDFNIKATKSIVIPSKKYVAYFEVASYEDAKTSCKAKGGVLATILNPDENAAVINAIGGSQHPSVWIGGDDLNAEGTFEWVNGDEFTYTNWLEGEPNSYLGNEDCLAVWPNFPTWNDSPCNVKRPYVCQFV